MLISFCYFDGGQWSFNDMLEQERVKRDPPFFTYLNFYIFCEFDLLPYNEISSI